MKLLLICRNKIFDALVVIQDEQTNNYRHKKRIEILEQQCALLLEKNERLAGENRALESACDYAFAQILKLSGLSVKNQETQTDVSHSIS